MFASRKAVRVKSFLEFDWRLSRIYFEMMKNTYGAEKRHTVALLLRRSNMFSLTDLETAGTPCSGGA